MTERIWDHLLTEQDREVYASGIFGGTAGIGERPAVVVVDVLNKSIGDEPLPILEAMKRFGKSCCGEYGWAAIPQHPRSDRRRPCRRPAGRVHDAAGSARPPGRRRSRPLSREKMPNWMDYAGERRDGYAFADEIAPEPGDIVIHKPTASSFYRTDFDEQLRAAGVDSLVVAGCTTSGCVRATVVDAHARGFKVNVVEDGVFDRGQTTHAINLFDMQAKYADVIPSTEVVRRISEVAAAAAAAR